MNPSDRYPVRYLNNKVGFDMDIKPYNHTTAPYRLFRQQSGKEDGVAGFADFTFRNGWRE